jgi:hypothetical protein
MPPHRLQTDPAPRRGWTRRRAGLAGLLLALAGLAAAAGVSVGREAIPPPPFVEAGTVFESTPETCYRIPAVAETEDGTLLAAAEQRWGRPWAAINGCSDDGLVDIVVRRSLDGGVSWTPMTVIVDHRAFIGPGDRVALAGNPTLVTVPGGRTVRMLFSVVRSAGYDNSPTCIVVPGRPMKPDCTDAPADYSLWQITSPDAGVTWGTPVPVDLPGAMSKFNRPGPGHAVVAPDGGLVAPGYPHLLVSRDGGETWAAGGQHRLGKSIAGSESAVAAFPDEIVGIVRPVAKYGRAAAARGETGAGFLVGATRDGSDWHLLTHLSGFGTPIVRIAAAAVLDPGDPVGRLAIASPAWPPYDDPPVTGTGARRDLTVFLGPRDFGGPFVAGLLHPGPAGYSDLLAFRDRTLGILYEGGTSTDRKALGAAYTRRIVFLRFPVSALEGCTAPFVSCSTVTAEPGS